MPYIATIIVWMIFFGFTALAIDLLPIPQQIKTFGRAAVIAFALIFLLQAFYRYLPIR